MRRCKTGVEMRITADLRCSPRVFSLCVQLVLYNLYDILSTRQLVCLGDFGTVCWCSTVPIFHPRTSRALSNFQNSYTAIWSRRVCKVCSANKLFETSLKTKHLRYSLDCSRIPLVLPPKHWSSLSSFLQKIV